jgi:hypothetical protein
VHEATLHRLGKFGQPDGPNTKVNKLVIAIFCSPVSAKTYLSVGTDAPDDSRTHTEGSVDHTP